MQPKEHLSLGQNRALHGFAIFTACCTFFLIIAGALVTGNDAGLAVPDWPLSYGSLTPPMVGGIFYEHGHRMVASFVGFLTIILAIWLWKRDERPFVRTLGWIALAVVVTQGILGGITVLFFLPAPISVMHACLAQAFFCIVSSLALLTSTGWKQGATGVASEIKGVSMYQLCLWTTVSVYGQLILGAALRHSKSGLLWHVLGAFAVTFLMAWTVARVYKYYAEVAQLFRPAMILGILLAAQLSLGVGSYLVRLASREDVQPGALMVAVTTAHVATGALVLVAALLLTLQCHRLLIPAKQKMQVNSVAQEATS
ncbi:MAG: COX15/CtaA family protein [Acidobacteria bacterium]|nr:COX15/CtaA family protein [Acidobacteriota bacterium]MCI0625441.1 COX15/CtaA family protein [Acidobacteriota bacterium]MCI0717523.1 COX15/CtaA family protein [Acidobacteriota bacterium]